MTVPSLSIVVTTHARPDLLARALAPLIANPSDQLEIILVADDGIKETINAARDLLRPWDAFVRAPSLRGPAESRNYGAKLARAQWLCFLDDDDTLSDAHIEHLLSSVDSLGKAVHFFNYQRINEKRSTAITSINTIPVDLSSKDSRDLLVENFIPINAMVIPSDVFIRHAFDTRLPSHEDWDFIVSLISAGVEFEWMSSPTNGVNVHIDSTERSRNKSSVPSLDYLSIYRKWPAPDETTKALRASRLKELGITLSPELL